MVEVHPEEFIVPDSERETKEQKARRESREALERLKEQHATAEEQYDRALARCEKANAEVREATSLLNRMLERRQTLGEQLIQMVQDRLVKGTITS